MPCGISLVTCFMIQLHTDILYFDCVIRAGACVDLMLMTAPIDILRERMIGAHTRLVPRNAPSIN